MAGSAGKEARRGRGGVGDDGRGIRRYISAAGRRSARARIFEGRKSRRVNLDFDRGAVSRRVDQASATATEHSPRAPDPSPSLSLRLSLCPKKRGQVFVWCPLEPGAWPSAASDTGSSSVQGTSSASCAAIIRLASQQCERRTQIGWIATSESSATLRYRVAPSVKVRMQRRPSSHSDAPHPLPRSALPPSGLFSASCPRLLRVHRSESVDRSSSAQALSSPLLADPVCTHNSSSNSCSARSLLASFFSPSATWPGEHI